MKKVVVSVTNDLVTDQRVHKVCTSLCSYGFSVLLVGRKLKDSQPISRVYETNRMQLLFSKGPLFYMEYNIRLFLKLLFVKKNVLLSNDLDTLLPNYLVSKLSKTPLIYDSHELFTQVPELINRPKTQKIWKSIEVYIFPKLKNVFTVSQSIVAYYTETYNVPVKLLRNLPEINSDKDIAVSSEVIEFINGKHAIIYQGAVNLGRGLELMIDTIKTLENTVLCVFGKGDVLLELTEKVKKENLSAKILLFGAVAPSELKRITPLFDVGLSLEEDLGMNYRYALPNKVFDYMLAGIPSLVSDLPEMKNLVSEYEIGEVLQDRSPLVVASQLNHILLNKDSYKTAIKKAQLKLNWEEESKVLKNTFEPFL
ncbi:glycosyltransferase [Flavobacteriaceae bacterium]|nr:glycosyltransferase [Flavobacteriaceae bacterium]